MNVMNVVVSSNSEEEKIVPIKTNIARMNSALSAERFAMPQGLSREEKRRFILDVGKK